MRSEKERLRADALSEFRDKSGLQGLPLFDCTLQAEAQKRGILT